MVSKPGARAPLDLLSLTVRCKGEKESRGILLTKNEANLEDLENSRFLESDVEYGWCGGETFLKEIKLKEKSNIDTGEKRASSINGPG